MCYTLSLKFKLFVTPPQKLQKNVSSSEKIENGEQKNILHIVS